MQSATSPTGGQRRSSPLGGGLWPNLAALAQCPPDARGRVSFLTPPLSLFGSIYDSNYPLGSGMNVDVPYLDRLLAPALKPLVCLHLVELKP